MSSISEPIPASKMSAHLNVQDRLSQAVFWIISTTWRATTDNAHALVSRFTGHLVVLALAACAVALSGFLRTWEQPEVVGSNRPAGIALAASLPITPTPANPLGERLDLPISARGGQTWRTTEVENVSRAAVPFTEIPSRLRRSVMTYTVQAGDTVQGIAIMFSLQPETVVWSNPDVEKDPDWLQIGQALAILPIDGVYHTVVKNDTLDSIAKKYKAKIENITGVPFNNLQPPEYKIEPGMKLIVAGGEKPYVPKVVTPYAGAAPQGARGTGRFQWPAAGTLTQSYWWAHRALDIAAATGTPVYAADSGYVTFVGWTDIGYGRLIIIDHGNGFVTYYAHMNSFSVVVGQAVTRGKLIGLMGSTGNSTGPHVHFEIRYNGTLMNPRSYLP